MEYSASSEDNANEINGRKLKSFSWHDIGNAERFVLLCDDDVLWVPAWRNWCVWNGRRWVRDESRQIMAKAKRVARAMAEEAKAAEDNEFLKFARGSSSIGKLRAMIELSIDEPNVTKTAEEFNRGNVLVNFRDGSLTRTRKGFKFREQRREDYCTLLVDCDYDPDARGPEWDRFLAEKWPDPEVRRYLQKLVGVSLDKGNPYQLLVFMWGKTNTGKSTFLEIISEALGTDYTGMFNLSLFRDNQDEKPRADIVDSIHKRLIHRSEASKAWELHGDQLKNMTGSDKIKGRLPHGSAYVEQLPDFMPWIATNDPPTVKGADAAVRRRMRVVPCTVQHADGADDEKLRDRIQETEREAVVAWVVEGRRMALAEGLEPPEAVIEATKEMSGQLTPADTFLDEMLVSDSEGWVWDDNAWNSYREWCSGSDLARFQRLDRSGFHALLADRGYTQERVRTGKGDNKKRVWYGFRLVKTGPVAKWAGPEGSGEGLEDLAPSDPDQIGDDQG